MHKLHEEAPHVFAHLRSFMYLAHKCFTELSPGANGTCPDPITINPQVVVEYGETATLNCTSPSNDDVDVFGKIGTEERDNYIEVRVTKWDLKAACVIQLNEHTQCSNEVDLVVYSKYQFN